MQMSIILTRSYQLIAAQCEIQTDEIRNGRLQSTMMIVIIARMEMFLLIVGWILIRTIGGMPSEPDYYRYLQQYGYTPKVEGRRLFTLVGRSSYSDGILKFQRLYKLPVRSSTSSNEHRTSILV